MRNVSYDPGTGRFQFGHNSAWDLCALDFGELLALWNCLVASHNGPGNYIYPMEALDDLVHGSASEILCQCSEVRSLNDPWVEAYGPGDRWRSLTDWGAVEAMELDDYSDEALAGAARECGIELEPLG